MIGLLVVDDHPVVRRGLGSCLKRYANLEVVGEAGDGQEAVRKARELRPDVVLMDIAMPRMDGLAAAEVLSKELPQIKVLILSAHGSAEYARRALQNGADGYVLKDASLEELVKAIEMVHSGAPFFSPHHPSVPPAGSCGQAGQGLGWMGLNNRERRVLAQLAQGVSQEDIAGRLGVGLRTVRAYRESIMDKLDIRAPGGLVRFALAKGLLASRHRRRR